MFPPLNVQAVSISSTSIEVRWTDSHLKPNETVLDDRYYTVRYCVAASSGTLNSDSSETISEIYRYKNSTERRITITGLAPSTLYDFSVRLAVGSRQSDWSLTASQMTMETCKNILFFITPIFDINRFIGFLFRLKILLLSHV